MSDLRDVVPCCPGCSGALRATEVDGVALEVCLVCGGVWFDWFVGEPSALSARLVSAERVDDDSHAPHPLGRMPSCPRDGTALERLPYLDGGPAVPRCPSCMGLFASRALLVELAAYHQRIPERTEGPIQRTSLLSSLWHTFIR